MYVFFAGLGRVQKRSDADDYVVIQMKDEHENCLYISKAPMWAYTSEDSTTDQAEAECHKMGLSLAGPLAPSEFEALAEVSSKIDENNILTHALLFLLHPGCKMGDVIPKESPLLVKPGPAQKCALINADGILGFSDV